MKGGCTVLAAPAEFSGVVSCKSHPRDDDLVHRVIWQGKVCAPSWRTRWLAQVYFDSLADGTRCPEYSREEIAK